MYEYVRTYVVDYTEIGTEEAATNFKTWMHQSDEKSRNNKLSDFLIVTIFLEARTYYAPRNMKRSKNIPSHQHIFNFNDQTLVNL